MRPGDRDNPFRGRAIAGSGGEPGGFTLIEIMLSLAILVLAIPVLASLFPWGMRQPAEARQRTQAVFLAQGLMEEIVTRKWDENALPPGKTNSPSTIGLDAGETAGDRSTFDDLDDYDGFLDNPVHDAVGATISTATPFWSQVQVDYVGSDISALDLDTPLAADAGTDFKKLTVTVSWPDGAVSLVTVRGNF